MLAKLLAGIRGGSSDGPRATWDQIVAKCDDDGVLEQLGAHEANPIAVEDCPSVLCAALRQGRFELVGRLITKGCRPAPSESVLGALLHAPPTARTLSILEMLLRTPGMTWAEELYNSRRFLGAILTLGPSAALLDLIRDVLCRQPRYQLLLDDAVVAEGRRERPLHCAARLNHTAAVEWLLRYGQHPIENKHKSTVTANARAALSHH